MTRNLNEEIETYASRLNDILPFNKPRFDALFLWPGKNTRFNQNNPSGTPHQSKILADVHGKTPTEWTINQCLDQEVNNIFLSPGGPYEANLMDYARDLQQIYPNVHILKHEPGTYAPRTVNNARKCSRYFHERDINSKLSNDGIDRDFLPDYSTDYRTPDIESRIINAWDLTTQPRLMVFPGDTMFQHRAIEISRLSLDIDIRYFDKIKFGERSGMSDESAFAFSRLPIHHIMGSQKTDKEDKWPYARTPLEVSTSTLNLTVGLKTGSKPRIMAKTGVTVWDSLPNRSEIERRSLDVFNETEFMGFSRFADNYGNLKPHSSAQYGGEIGVRSFAKRGSTLVIDSSDSVKIFDIDTRDDLRDINDMDIDGFLNARLSEDEKIVVREMNQQVRRRYGNPKNALREIYPVLKK